MQGSTAPPLIIESLQGDFDMTFRAGVVGAAGFAGIEAVRLLLGHPDFELVCATSDANAGARIDEMYPALRGSTTLEFTKNADADLGSLDVAFLAVPHTAAMSVAPALIDAGTVVIDLSADFRLKDPDVYANWYSTPHTEVALLEKSAFGLPEIKGEEIRRAAGLYASGESVLVACAGCYPTATSLAAAPALIGNLVKEDALIVADAISGVTGAGKKASERTHFCFANENLEAYGVTTHRHTPEIEQILEIPNRLVFTPHLAPLNRGLLSTVTIPIDAGLAQGIATTEDFVSLYKDFYKTSPFVCVLDAGKQPRTASVIGTNNAQIGLSYNSQLGVLVAVCAIDNLGKGAAGQAVQCANIVFGLPQAAGLSNIAKAI